MHNAPPEAYSTLEPYGDGFKLSGNLVVAEPPEKLKFGAERPRGTIEVHVLGRSGMVLGHSLC